MSLPDAGGTPGGEKLGWFLAAAVLAAVLLVRGIYWFSLTSSPLSQWYLWRETDEHSFLESSERVAAGNWLDSPAYRAYHSWQVAYGPAEAWESWYQKNAYFQGPLYVYFLAAVRKAVGFPVPLVRAFQLLVLGPFTAAFVAFTLSRVLERRGLPVSWHSVAVLLGGLSYGLYGPLIFHDGFLYRDGPFTHLSTFLLLVPLLVKKRVSLAFVLAFGLFGGVITLLKQTALPFALFSVCLTAVAGVSGRARIGRLAAAVFGVVLPVVPLVFRNLAVGAPALAFDTRQQVCLVWGTARGADGTTAPSPLLGVILEEAQGSTGKLVRLILESYRDDPMGLVDLEIRKLISFFNALEIPDNANYHFFLDRFAVLWFVPGWAVLLGPGLAGLAFAVRARILTRMEGLLFTVGFLVTLASCLMVSTTSRYRVSVTGILAIGGALGLVVLVEAFLKGHSRTRILQGIVLTVAVSSLAMLPPVVPQTACRYADTLVAATLFEAFESPEAGAGEIARYLMEGEADQYRGDGLLAVSAWLSGVRATQIDAPGVAPPGKRYRRPTASWQE